MSLNAKNVLKVIAIVVAFLWVIDKLNLTDKVLPPSI